MFRAILFGVLFFCVMLGVCSCNSDTDRARSLVAHLSELGIVNNEKANLKLLYCTKKWHENSFVFSATTPGGFNQEAGFWTEYAPSDKDEFYAMHLNAVLAVCERVKPPLNIPFRPKLLNFYHREQGMDVYLIQTNECEIVVVSFI